MARGLWKPLTEEMKSIEVMIENVESSVSNLEFVPTPELGRFLERIQTKGGLWKIEGTLEKTPTNQLERLVWGFFQ